MEREETKFRGAKAELTKHISTASLGAASASHWCPMSYVMVKGSPLHHFLVTVQPDTIDHGDTSTIKAQAKDQNNSDIEAPAGTKANVSLNDSEKYGNLTYEALRGLVISDVPYASANEGRVKFVADGENPIGKPPQPVPIGVTSDGKEGTGQVVVRCKVQPPRYPQGGRGTSRPAWADSIYDNSGKNIATLGCALSTMAMVMTAYGDTVNPGQLNSWKKQAPQDSGGYRGESINWNAITKHSKGEIRLSYSKARFWKDSLRTAVDSTQMSDPGILDSNLDVCKLVIVQVYNKETGNQHWVLVTRKLGGRYTIVDPGGRNEQFLDAYGPFWSYLIVSKN
ncbi:MAG: hypothetical protein FJ217_09530 [Ignavibacteria bacterium]|nr:hypothetical protein [Ignavibacteria bacterium]